MKHTKLLSVALRKIVTVNMASVCVYVCTCVCQQTCVCM